MENLIRIEFDPHRGGPNEVDSLRPNFCLSEWPSEDIEIWKSVDGGLSWDKLTDAEYRASYSAAEREMYVSLLLDITEPALLGFFDVDGNIVGVGYTGLDLAAVACDLVQVGWSIDGPCLSTLPTGWSTGSASPFQVPAGFFVEGGEGWNTPVGYNVKDPNRTNVQVGHTVSAPVDIEICVGASIGTVFVSSAGVGVTILGLSEFPGAMFSLDQATIDALCAQAAWRKQKKVTLTDTNPEELD